MHCKQWEYAQLLEVRQKLAANARRLVGIGCGCEKTIPLVGRGAERCTVTDLYGREDAWQTAHANPKRVFPEMTNLEVHSMDMRRVDLPKRSADFVWSLCAVEHAGTLLDIISAVRQAGELLDEDGLLFISTELNLGKRDYRTSNTVFLSRPMITQIVQSSGLHLFAPIELRISDHPMNTPVSSAIEPDVFGQVVYRDQKNALQGTMATVVSFVLGRRDRGVREVWNVDPAYEQTLAKLVKRGRRLSRRLTPPWRWW